MSRILFALLLALPLAAQPDWFPRRDMMTIGVYYYPEAWPEAQWPRDVANIRKLGMEFIHMGEFAWAVMEPKEGQYDFAWLDKNVALAKQNGLKVILCTPTPTPPIWLVREHPEVLMVDAAGRRQDHGSREHACWSVPKYREYAAKIIQQLADRYGKDDRVWGWQLDNELSHYGKRYCYCDHCTRKFRAWLKQKYGTVEKLNRDWGNVFWSQTYQNFDQINIPNAQVLPQQPNPHAILDFQRWFADEAADYLKFQTAILRKASGGKQWITTNYMNMNADVDPSRSAKDLDGLSFTLYPVHGNQPEGSLGFRLGDPGDMSFMHDFLRPMSAFEGLMELQPGQVNWGEVNPIPQPGAIRLWIMRAFAAGARFVCTYRYRQPLFGGELYHYGLVGTDGVTPSIGGEQYSQAMREVAELRKLRPANPVEPKSYAARRTAFLIDWDSRWDMEQQKQTKRWSTNEHWLKNYRALKRLGAPVDVLTADADFSKHPFAVVAAQQLADEQQAARWRAYAEKGGHLVLTARTAHKDRRGHLWEGPWAKPILDLIGATIEAYDVLPGSVEGTVTAGGKSYPWGAWGEILRPAGATVLATYSDQFYKGKAAAVTRKLGKGSVTYVGVDTFDGELEKDILAAVYRNAGVATLDLPRGLMVDWRDGFWVATNFNSAAQSVPAPNGTRFVIGARNLDPAGVAVWVE